MRKRMRLTSCFLPQGKALYICVCSRMKRIFHLTFSRH